MTQNSPLAAMKGEFYMSARTTIQVRVSEEDKAFIAERASRRNQTISAYLLSKALEPEETTDDIVLRQSVARALCELNCLEEQMESTADRKIIRGWEESIWRFLKL